MWLTSPVNLVHLELSRSPPNPARHTGRPVAHTMLMERAILFLFTGSREANSS